MIRSVHAIREKKAVVMNAGADTSGTSADRVRLPRVRRFCRRSETRFSLQEQKEIPSSGAHRSEDLGAFEEEGSRGELAAQCDTYARIFLLQESPVHQLRINEVRDTRDRAR